MLAPEPQESSTRARACADPFACAPPLTDCCPPLSHLPPKAIFQCSQSEEGASPRKVELEVISKYEMAMSRAMTRRGWNIEGLNLLQRGVDWRNPDNARGCARVTRTCAYKDYVYGPPDLMFLKLSAEELRAEESTYAWLGRLYNDSWTQSDAFERLYGFRRARSSKALPRVPTFVR